MKTRVVTLSHATGAGGHTIGRTVAEQLGFRYIDEEIIAMAAEKEQVDAAAVADTERRKGFLDRLFDSLAVATQSDAIAGGAMLVPEAGRMFASDHLRRLIVEAIHETAERGQVVIVSHAASIPLAGRPDVLRAFVTASVDTRVARVDREQPEGVGSPATIVKDSDAGRADYFQRFYKIERELPTHYDLVINTDLLSADEASDIIVATARRRS
jgi:cytidylate kinase